MSVAFVPLYLAYIGSEGYGLQGTFWVLVALLSILDGGLGAAAGQRLTRACVGSPQDREGARDLVFSLEIVFALIAALAGLFLLGLTPWLAAHWLRVEELPLALATRCLQLLALSFALQWPATFYQTCLGSLQRQRELSKLLVLNNSFRSLGAVGALMLVPRPEAFFAWQAVAALALTASLRVTLWRAMPAGPRARFRSAAISSIGRFGANIGGLGALSLVSTQADKVLLSRLLPLAEFGNYSLAWNLVSQVYRVTPALQAVLQPQLTHFAALRDEAGLRRAFHQGSRLLALMLVPAMLGLVWFSAEVAWLWTHDRALAGRLAPLLASLGLAVLANSLLFPAYGLQLAFQDTRVAWVNNLLSVPLLLPALIESARQGGATGCGVCLAVWHGLSLLICGPLALRRLLPGQAGRWLSCWVLAPALGSSLVYAGVRTGLAWWPRAESLSPLAWILILAGSGGLALALVMRLTAAWAETREQAL